MIRVISTLAFGLSLWGSSLTYAGVEAVAPDTESASTGTPTGESKSPGVISTITLKVVDALGELQTVTYAGRILIAAQDGSALLERTDGTLLSIKGTDVTQSSTSETPFAYDTPAVMTQALREEFGDGFEVFETEHYVMVTDAGKVYAEWCGKLLERLHSGFYDYWQKAGLELIPVPAKLPVVLLANPEEFKQYAIADAGAGLAQAKGYYSARTNRIILTDLRADDGGVRAREDRDVARRIEASPLNVATVVHEASHQIAFNSGLHTRYADNPLWLTEGFAMYCETPDIRGTGGWRTIGTLHRSRLKDFEDYVKQRRKIGSLASLLEGGDRFRNPATVQDAYAESWAFTYFLMRRHKEKYIEYLQRISQKHPLDWNTSPVRLDEFRQVFGDDLDAIEKEFLIYIRRL